jgi:hypothetical protein
MSFRSADFLTALRSVFKAGFSQLERESTPALRGRFIQDLRDAATGRVLEHREEDNLITNDAGILVAILLASGATPTPPSQRGLTMLAVGTGAPGALLSPDAPDVRQRHLYAEIARKPFSATVFRTAAGAVSSVPTNIVDFTTSFGEGEAVGPLNEMGLVRTISTNPATLNPVVSTFPTYDTTVDVSTRDILFNVVHHAVLSKPASAILTVTWRITC